VKPGGPEEVTRLIQRDLARWKDVVARANISID
jgi:hypothetical protein